MWKILSKIFKVIIITVLAFSCIVLIDLIMEQVSKGSTTYFAPYIRAGLLCFICFLTVYGVCLLFYSSKLVCKIIVFTLIILLFLLISIYLFNYLDFFKGFKSVSDLRKYLLSFKNTSIVFIIVQFLQVVFLPIPSIIVTGAGVLLFGPLKCAMLSCVGVILGSILSFFIGRLLGYKFVCWFFGKNIVDKWLDRIEQKSKLILVFAFLFPFFPDDTICALSGITKIKFCQFLLIIILTRIVAIFVSCYTLNNDLLPLNKWWGVLVLLLILVVSFTLIYNFIVKPKNDKKIDKN